MTHADSIEVIGWALDGVIAGVTERSSWPTPLNSALQVSAVDLSVLVASDSPANILQAMSRAGTNLDTDRAAAALKILAWDRLACLHGLNDGAALVRSDDFAMAVGASPYVHQCFDEIAEKKRQFLSGERDDRMFDSYPHFMPGRVYEALVGMAPWEDRTPLGTSAGVAVALVTIRETTDAYCAALLAGQVQVDTTPPLGFVRTFKRYNAGR